MPDYLTPTVMGIINNIRQTQDYSACPILADALQDADFPENQVWQVKAFDAPHLLMAPGSLILKRLREDTDITDQYRLLCLILGGEYVESLDWIDEFVRKMGDSWGYDGPPDEGDPPREPEVRMTYRLFIEVLGAYLDGDQEGITEHGSENWRDEFHAHFEEVWKHYEIVTGRDTSTKDNWGPFYCSC